MQFSGPVRPITNAVVELWQSGEIIGPVGYGRQPQCTRRAQSSFEPRSDAGAESPLPALSDGSARRIPGGSSGSLSASGLPAPTVTLISYRGKLSMCSVISCQIRWGYKPKDWARHRPVPTAKTGASSAQSWPCQLPR